MKLRLKKMTMGLLIIGIMLSASFAGIAQAADSETMTKIYSLDRFITEAINNNPEIKLLDKQIATQEMRYKNMVTIAEDQVKYESNPSKDLAEIKRSVLLYPAQAKNRLNQLKWEKQNKQMSIKADASKLYHQCVYKQYEIEMQTKSLERAKAELAAEKEKVRLGKVTNLSLGQNENAVEQADQRLVKLDSELSTVSMKINALLNYDLDRKLKFNTETVKIDEYKVSDLEALIAARKTESNSITKLKGQIEEAKLDAYTESYNRGNVTSNYEILLDKPKELENEIELEKYNIEQKLRTDYLGILEAYDGITVAKLQYELSSKLFEVAGSKYKYDMISYVDYLKAADDKANALNQYDQAQLAYLTAVMDFKLYIEQL